MKRWIFTSLMIFTVLSFRAHSLLSDEVNHHELIGSIDSETKKVELYWSSPSKSAEKLPAIVYVHGAQDNNSRPGAVNMVNGGLLKFTVDLGYFAVATSMPGYGQSSGEADFCGRQSQSVLQSVLKYLRTRPDVDAKNIAVSGISCGAITAAMIADKESLAAMILISGVYDFEDMFKKWQTPAWKLETETMNYITKSVETDGGLRTASLYRSALPNAKHFKMPVLLVAGVKDPIVDYNQSSTLAKAVQSNGYSNEFILNPEGVHMVSYEDWARYATEFLKKQSQKIH